jgi:hypothetical protein
VDEEEEVALVLTCEDKGRSSGGRADGVFDGGQALGVYTRRRMSTSTTRMAYRPEHL